MNAERLRGVAAKLRSLKENEGFDMGWWLTQKKECGTVGCIAGWTCVLYGKPQYNGPNSMDNKNNVDATKLLGLTWQEADKLFTPDRDTEKCTPEQAAEVLEDVADGTDIEYARAKRFPVYEGDLDPYLQEEYEGMFA